MGCVDRALGLPALGLAIVFWEPDLSVITPAGTSAPVVAQMNDTLNELRRVPDVIKID